MKKKHLILQVILFLLINYTFTFADTTFVNQNIYENREIYLCDESLNCNNNEYRFIDIKGYGLLYVSITDQCTDKPCYGIFYGYTYGLTIELSESLQYDTLEENWNINYLPAGLVEVPNEKGRLPVVSSFDTIVYHPIVSTLSSTSGTNNEDIILPFHENGSWSMTGSGPGGSGWINYFGNVNEVFYLSRNGENTIKFQIIEISSPPNPWHFMMCFASDSLGNGIFQTDTLNISNPYVEKNNKDIFPKFSKIKNCIYFDDIRPNTEVYIYNLQGALMKSERLSSKNRDITLNFPKGMYILSVVNYKKRYSTRILIR